MRYLTRFFQWAVDGVGKLVWMGLAIYWVMVGAALLVAVLLGDTLPARKVPALLMAALCFLLARWCIRRFFLATHWV